MSLFLYFFRVGVVLCFIVVYSRRLIDLVRVSGEGGEW